MQRTQAWQVGQTLARRRARPVLAAWVFALLAATLAPLLQSGAWQWVCSAAGAHAVWVDDAGQPVDRSEGPTLQCAQCLPAWMPAPAGVAALVIAPTSEAALVQRLPLPPGAAAWAAWQARAPPAIG